MLARQRFWGEGVLGRQGMGTVVSVSVLLKLCVCVLRQAVVEDEFGLASRGCRPWTLVQMFRLGISLGNREASKISEQESDMNRLWAVGLAWLLALVVIPAPP